MLVLSMMMSNCPTTMLLIVCFGSSTIVFAWRLGGAGLVGERVRGLQFFFPLIFLYLNEANLNILKIKSGCLVSPDLGIKLAFSNLKLQCTPQS